MTTLQNRIVLNRFMADEFGFESQQAMLDLIRNENPHLSALGNSEYARILSTHSKRLDRPKPHLNKFRVANIDAYDSNITALSSELGMTEERGREWKPFQYLSLLFAEHYLFRYFDDPESLCHELNRLKSEDRLTSQLQEYTLDDLATVAFQSATGSGKTLIMHANIRQYQHYLDRFNGRLNNIIVVTPNERMSAQHFRELTQSGIYARIFTAESTSEVHSTVEVIDLNKLSEKRGIKRVSVSEFGQNNLVLVDEGHLGATGEVWRQRRQELSHSGFTFEYSATFNQVASKDKALRDIYSKSLLFDYSYRQFHEDGYGKDYQITNLPYGMADANSDLYLLGCLLTFYQQLRIWHDNHVKWKDYNLAKPLWVFLGKTVIGSSSNTDVEARSDVIRILNFLAWILHERNTVRDSIRRLLSGKSGMVDEVGNEFFKDQFHYLNQKQEQDIYGNICNLLFHGQGQLRIIYLTDGDGELHLQAAENETFGVVNVGDSVKLFGLLEQHKEPQFSLIREAGFAQKLFPKVDQGDSAVNIVVGARRFIAGWSSWRVATMGLMHVGVGEGPEIIQMFGRGVRLKGRKMSLKRHRNTEEHVRDFDLDLAELEKLYIFGLRANYMEIFRKHLEVEGVRIEPEEFSVPVTWNFEKVENLPILEQKNEIEFQVSKERVQLPGPTDSNSETVTVDLYSQLQAITSNESSTSELDTRQSVKLGPEIISLFNSMRIYDRLLKVKYQKQWHNLGIRNETVQELMTNSDWYNLYMPPNMLQPSSLAELLRLEEIFLRLLIEYAEQFWSKERRNWQKKHVDVVDLNQEHPNVVYEYRLTVDSTEKDLFLEIESFLENATHENMQRVRLNSIETKLHAYQPLLYAEKDCKISVHPVALNMHEAHFVSEIILELEHSAHSDQDYLHGYELYLLRNLTGSKGVSFFDDFGYYPDFIIWLIAKHVQHMIFLDPKGLMNFGERERRKVELHKNIKELESELREKHATLHLHSFIVSGTPIETLRQGRPREDDWRECGVHFIRTRNFVRNILEDVIATENS